MRGRLVVKSWGAKWHACDTCRNNKRNATVLLVTYGHVCVPCAIRMRRDLERTLAALEGSAR